MKWNTKKIAKRLDRMGLSFESAGLAFQTFWFRYIVNTAEKPAAKMHFHSFYEIHYIFQGRYIVKIDDVTYEVGAGEYIVINKKEKHSILYESADLNKIVWGLDVHSNDADKQKRLVRFGTNIAKVRCYPLDQKMEMMFACLFCETENLSYDYKHMIETYLYCIFFESLRNVQKVGMTAIEEGQLDKRMEKIVKFISDNVYFPITARDLSEEFFLCERQLNRLSQEYYAMSIGSLIKSFKIEESKKLLKDTDHSIEEIALMLNFSDVSLYIKNFKRFEGHTPLAYRKSVRGTL